jgi:hypothetical protein
MKEADQKILSLLRDPPDFNEFREHDDFNEDAQQSVGLFHDYYAKFGAVNFLKLQEDGLIQLAKDGVGNEARPVPFSTFCEAGKTKDNDRVYTFGQHNE